MASVIGRAVVVAQLSTFTHETWDSLEKELSTPTTQALDLQIIDDIVQGRRAFSSRNNVFWQHNNQNCNIGQG